MYGGRKNVLSPRRQGFYYSQGSRKETSSSLSLRVTKGQGLQVCLKNTEV